MWYLTFVSFAALRAEHMYSSSVFDRNLLLPRLHLLLSRLLKLQTRATRDSPNCWERERRGRNERRQPDPIRYKTLHPIQQKGLHPIQVQAAINSIGGHSLGQLTFCCPKYSVGCTLTAGRLTSLRGSSMGVPPFLPHRLEPLPRGIPSGCRQQPT